MTSFTKLTSTIDAGKADVPNGIREAMESLGFTRPMGSGMYGSVYNLTETRLLKVGFQGMMDGWLPFAYWSILHPNPHLPKVFRLRTYHHGAVYLAEIERLYPVTVDGNRLARWEPDDIEILCPGLLEDMGHFQDIGADHNVMRRGSHVVVFNDPYSSTDWTRTPWLHALRSRLDWGDEIDYAAP